MRSLSLENVLIVAFGIVLVVAVSIDAFNDGIVDMHQVRAVLHMKQDPFSVEELVKKHPSIQEICDIAGGCSYVKIECKRYDNTGNTNLRGQVMWDIKAAGAEGWGYVGGLEGSVRDWHHDYDRTPVYPHKIPCDQSCIGGN